MRLTIRVKAGAYRDRLWRDGSDLVLHVREDRDEAQTNAYIMRYLAGCLRVSPNSLRLVKGKSATTKVIDVSAPEADLRPMLDALEAPPQTSLFDS
jgi:uncharacterized protein YggU (UPF0235/DUF167 family)